MLSLRLVNNTSSNHNMWIVFDITSNQYIFIIILLDAVEHLQVTIMMSRLIIGAWIPRWIVS